jgi:hypothetical protein
MQGRKKTGEPGILEDMRNHGESSGIRKPGPTVSTVPTAAGGFSVLTNMIRQLYFSDIQ